MVLGGFRSFHVLVTTIHKLFSIVWGAQSGCWRGKESHVQVPIEGSIIYLYSDLH